MLAQGSFGALFAKERVRWIPEEMQTNILADQGELRWLEPVKRQLCQKSSVGNVKIVRITLFR